MNESGTKLTVYSASAGSGKTFSLTVEYVRKLLTNPKSYRSILAVTFTNKATAEMKNRILSVLWNMVYDVSRVQSEIDAIKRAKNAVLSEEEAENAKSALMYILHDYDHFWIETIDSFFQRVLRNMAKEIGVGSSFEILLNDNDYVEEAVKELKEDVSENKWLEECLSRLIKKRQSEGEKWNYEKDLLKFSEDLRKKIVSDEVSRIGVDDLKDILSQADDAMKMVREFEKQIKAYVRTVEEICEQHELELKKYCYVPKTNGKYSIRTDDGECKILKDKVNEEELFGSIYEELQVYYDKNYVKCREAYLLYNSIYKLCLLTFIDSRKRDLIKEDNCFLLRDTQKLLGAMVSSEDVVPFVYERIGSRIRNIMIDEFQDTSSQAWRNFMFLLKECLASGGGCAVFGDVKQSIYRWNGGDWQILQNLYDGMGEKEYSISTEGKSLSDNYRTDEEIVNFNNAFFSQAFKWLKINIEKQTPKKNAGSGELRFRFLNKSKELCSRAGSYGSSDFMMDETINEVNYYLSQGYGLGDIVILFRKTSEMQKFAERFAKDYNIASSDALVLAANDGIKKIIFLLRFIVDKKDSIARYWLENIVGIDDLEKLNAYRQKTISLIDLVLKLIKDFEINAQDEFVLAFCDKLAKYCSDRGNGLRDFLQYWTDVMSQEVAVVGKKKDTLELQTIHKAKGLEYDVVIIPFCEWDFVDGGHDVWFENPEQGSKVNIFPSRLNGLLGAGDKYEQLREREAYLQRVDNLNILYVAFTRPKHCLSIICQEPKVTPDYKKEPTKKVSHLLYNYFQTGEVVKAPKEQAKDIRMLVTRGTPTPKKKQEKTETANSNPFMVTPSPVELGADCRFDFSDTRYALSKSAFEYFETVDKDGTNDNAQWGTLVHSVLSQIKTERDLQRALKFADTERSDELKAIINDMFKFVESRHWFDGTYKVITEQSIVDNSCEEKQRVKRPDRIMIGENEITVVDYKFMQDIEQTARYEEQIREYGRRLTTMGYKNIRLYLWAVQSVGNQSKDASELLQQKVVEVKLKQD